MIGEYEYASPQFWEAYEEYASSSLGRHNRAVGFLGGLVPPVLDLGCGKVAEGRRL